MRADSRQQLDAMQAVNAGMEQARLDSNSHSDAVKDSIDAQTNQAHTDSNNIKDSVTSLENSVNANSDTAHQDAQNSSDRAHEDASDIKDAIKGNEEDYNSRVQQDNEAFKGISDFVDSSVASITSQLSAIKATLNGETPTVSYSGSCGMSGDIFGKNVDFALGLDRMLLMFKPFLLFVLNLVYILYMAKLVVLAFRDIMTRIQTNLI